MAKKKAVKEPINYVVSSLGMNDLIVTSPSLREAYETELASNGEVVYEKLYVYEMKLLGEIKTDLSIVPVKEPAIA